MGGEADRDAARGWSILDRRPERADTPPPRARDDTPPPRPRRDTPPPRARDDTPPPRPRAAAPAPPELGVPVHLPAELDVAEGPGETIITEPPSAVLRLTHPARARLDRAAPPPDVPADRTALDLAEPQIAPPERLPSGLFRELRAALEGRGSEPPAAGTPPPAGASLLAGATAGVGGERPVERTELDLAGPAALRAELERDAAARERVDVELDTALDLGAQLGLAPERPAPPARGDAPRPRPDSPLISLALPDEARAEARGPVVAEAALLADLSAPERRPPPPEALGGELAERASRTAFLARILARALPILVGVILLLGLLAAMWPLLVTEAEAPERARVVVEEADGTRRELPQEESPLRLLRPEARPAPPAEP